MAETIHDFVRAGNIDEVRTLIATGCDINASDKFQRTPLHLAAWAGQFEILDLLLKSKANVEKKAMDEFTILHFAVQSSNKDVKRVTDCIRLIIKKAKQLLNQRISKGNKSALHLAVSKGNEDIVKCLLECGIDVNAKMSNGQTAMDIAKSSSMKTLLLSTSEISMSNNEKVEKEGDIEETKDTTKEPEQLFKKRKFGSELNEERDDEQEKECNN